MRIHFEPAEHTYYALTDKGKHIIVPSVTQLLNSTGVIPHSDYVIPAHYSERGTKVHEMTELVDSGEFLEHFCDDEILLYVMQYQAWLQQNDVEMLESEQVVFHDTLFYAGTLDRIARVNGVEYIIDYKTGNPYRWHDRQLTAYQKAVGKYRIANLYLGKFEHKFVEQQPVDGIVEAMSRCYWDGRPQAYNWLKKEIV